MLYSKTVSEIDLGTHSIITTDGSRLYATGNRFFLPGDIVYTDGTYAYGLQKRRGGGGLWGGSYCLYYDPSYGGLVTIDARTFRIKLLCRTPAIYFVGAENGAYAYTDDFKKLFNLVTGEEISQDLRGEDNQDRGYKRVNPIVGDACISDTGDLLEISALFEVDEYGFYKSGVGIFENGKLQRFVANIGLAKIFSDGSWVGFTTKHNFLKSYMEELVSEVLKLVPTNSIYDGENVEVDDDGFKLFSASEYPNPDGSLGMQVLTPFGYDGEDGYHFFDHFHFEYEAGVDHCVTEETVNFVSSNGGEVATEYSVIDDMSTYEDINNFTLDEYGRIIYYLEGMLKYKDINTFTIDESGYLEGPGIGGRWQLNYYSYDEDASKYKGIAFINLPKKDCTYTDEKGMLRYDLGYQKIVTFCTIYNDFPKIGGYPKTEYLTHEYYPYSFQVGVRYNGAPIMMTVSGDEHKVWNIDSPKLLYVRENITQYTPWIVEASPGKYIVMSDIPTEKDEKASMLILDDHLREVNFRFARCSGSMLAKIKATAQNLWGG